MRACWLAGSNELKGVIWPGWSNGMRAIPPKKNRAAFAGGAVGKAVALNQVALVADDSEVDEMSLASFSLKIFLARSASSPLSTWTEMR